MRSSLIASPPVFILHVYSNLIDDYTQRRAAEQHAGCYQLQKEIA